MEIKEVKLHQVKYGKNVKIVNPSNLYYCELHDDVFVGPFVEIQKGVKIGKRTKVQSHAFICELVSVGKDCFIGHGVMFINDTFNSGGPANGMKSKWKPTKIGSRVFIGSNSTILPIKICNDVVIGAGSVVTKDINVPGFYVGNPAKFLRPHE